MRSSSKTPNLSFEFFPPKTPEMELGLWRTVERLAPLKPRFVSVTYGAGGSTRERTHKTVKRLLEETDLTPAAHLTCVAASKDEVDTVIRDYKASGVRHIVALRGDPPKGVAASDPHTKGYANATELVQAVKKLHPDCDISVGCYPEGHPENASLDQDIDVLKAKIDAGANLAISQFFFDVEGFLRFCETLQKKGVFIPILPGIMPIISAKGLKTMAGLAKIHIPDWLGQSLEGFDLEDAETKYLIACGLTARLCQRLQSEGFHDFHVYTLNRAEISYALAKILKAWPDTKM